MKLSLSTLGVKPTFEESKGIIHINNKLGWMLFGLLGQNGKMTSMNLKRLYGSKFQGVADHREEMT